MKAKNKKKIFNTVGLEDIDIVTNHEFSYYMKSASKRKFVLIMNYSPIIMLKQCIYCCYRGICEEVFDFRSNIEWNQIRAKRCLCFSFYFILIFFLFFVLTPFFSCKKIVGKEYIHQPDTKNHQGKFNATNPALIMEIKLWTTLQLEPKV